MAFRIKASNQTSCNLKRSYFVIKNPQFSSKTWRKPGKFLKQPFIDFPETGISKRLMIGSEFVAMVARKIVNLLHER